MFFLIFWCAVFCLQWPAYKGFNSGLWDFNNGTGPTGYYQETLLHAALVGADAFHYFNPWSLMTYGTRATMADHRTLSATLTELDNILGCANRVWLNGSQHPLSAGNRWNDSFHLTGMAVGVSASSDTTAVWRFTPNSCTNAAGHSKVAAMVHSESVSGITISPVYVGGEENRSCSLAFSGGSIVGTVNSTVVAPFGVWIRQSGMHAGVELRCPVAEEAGRKASMKTS